MGGAIIIVSISVGLLEVVHVLILTVVTSGNLVDITLILGYILYIRVESGSDDPDNLGHLDHFFSGTSGSHPQTKLSGSDPDITCSLENSVGIWVR